MSISTLLSYATPNMAAAWSVAINGVTKQVMHKLRGSIYLSSTTTTMADDQW
jgi:hypothetical protein